MFVSSKYAEAKIVYLGNMMVGLMMRVVPYVISNLQCSHGCKVRTVDFVLVSYGSQGDVFDAVLQHNFRGYSG